MRNGKSSLLRVLSLRERLSLYLSIASSAAGDADEDSSSSQPAKRAQLNAVAKNASSFRARA